MAMDARATKVDDQGASKSQVSEELSQMDSAIGKLQNAVADLEGRLEQVLVPEPTSKADGGTPEPVLASLPSSMREQRKGILASVSRIRDLISRLAI